VTSNRVAVAGRLMDNEQKLVKITEERDRAREVIESIKCMLGIKRKWSDQYGYNEFLEDAGRIIVSQLDHENIEGRPCSYCGYPKKYPGIPCELCHNI